VTIPSVQIPESEILSLQKPFVNDFLAYYKQLEEETMLLVERAQDEGWTPEELMREIDLLIAGDNRPAATEVR
jgi:predicted PolB exonuclease-like 3'-5' exonuclease